MLAAVSCQHEEIWDKLNDHEQRIEQLEKLCKELNSNVMALQTALTAIQENDYVTDVMKVVENGVEVGYSLTFAKAGTVTLYHGTDGADAVAPKIGVRKAQDGAYYWTSGDEWLTADDGSRIPATVASEAGYVTPQFRVAEDVWYVSFDNGNSWRVIEGVGESVDNQFFSEVTYDDHYIHLTLLDGEKISIPRNDVWIDGNGGVEYPFSEYGYLGPNGVLQDTYSDNVYYTTDYINITKAASIYYHGRMGPVSNYYSVAFYDANKKFIPELSICRSEQYCMSLLSQFHK